MTETTQTLDLKETDDIKFKDNLNNIDFDKKVQLNNFELKKDNTKNNERIKDILGKLKSKNYIDNLIERIQTNDRNKDNTKNSIFYYIIKFKQDGGERINKDEFEKLGEYSGDGKLKIPKIDDEEDINKMNGILKQIMFGLKSN